MDVDDAGEFLFAVEDEDGSDFSLVHQPEGCHGKLVLPDGRGVGVHGFPGGQVQRVILALFHQAAKVAVGDDPGNFGAVFDHCFNHYCEAQPLAAHLVDYIGHGSVARDLWQLVAAVHQLLYLEQHLAEAATGMETAEIFFLEAVALKQSDGKGITHGHGGGGGGCRGKVQRAGFALDADVEYNVGSLGKFGTGVAGESQNRNAHVLERGNQVGDFRRLAAVAQGEQHVTFDQHAEVAVGGVTRMNKERRRAGRSQRGGNLLADESRLAHAGDHNAARRVEDKLDRAVETLVQPLEHTPQTFYLDLQHPLGDFPAHISNSKLGNSSRQSPKQ